MSGIDERPKSVIIEDENFRSITQNYCSEEQEWERHVADRIRVDTYRYWGGESPARQYHRQLTEAFREYEELYEGCLIDVLQSESLNLDRQQIEAIVSTVEGRLRFVSWSRRNSRWYRFKRWLRNVW